MPTSNVTSEQVTILRSLFSGRNDAYGIIGEKGPLCVREPLTDTLLAKHLSGPTRIGQYPLSKNSTIRWACVDIDSLAREKVERVIVSCTESSLFPYVELSRSKGYHVWIFFDEPVKAQYVRKVLAKVLKDADASDCEIFPKQDSLTSDNGLGNFVFLPLQGDSVKEKRTVFVDSQLEPYVDQWDHLSRIHRTKAENILSMAEEITQEQPRRDEPKMDPESPEGSLDVANYLIHYKVKFQEKKESTRKIFQLIKCLWADNHTGEEDGKGHAAIIQGNDGKITYYCFHKHCQSKTWQDARQKISSEASLAQFLKGYAEPQGVRTRNLTEDLREWVEMAYGNFATAQIYNDLDVKTTADKTLVRVTLHRMAERKSIERGISSGTFRKIDRENNIIKIEEAASNPLPLKWPGGLEDYVKIMRKSTIGVAGTIQAGKTAYLLNCAWLNKDLMPTCYFTSEFGGDELRERLEPFGHQMNEWNKIVFSERSRDFQDVIDPDGLNIIDYLEVGDGGEFFKMGIQIKRIYEKLRQGVAIIGLQKKSGTDFAYGGEMTAEKPRLYITLESHILRVKKAKLWKGSQNPYGMSRRFKLLRGANFIWESWEYPKL